MRGNNKTIFQVLKNDLCTGCGTCIALCPEEAIEMVINEEKGIYVPKLSEINCNNCGICYKVCPGHEVDFKGLNLEIFGKDPDDILLGNHLNCYIGHAIDYDIRYNSASGGLVTQLLIFALDEGIIDGALVTRMKSDNPLEPEPFIARTREEIIEASKSKYCPVSVNIALREILESKEVGRFAVVGLPCHIQGVRKAQRVNAKLRERVVLCLGLFCGHAPNFIGTEFLLNKTLGIKKEDVEKLDYRGEGWPGRISVALKNGDKRYIPYNGAWGIFGLFFYPTRCMLCCDGVCEFADISFADAWLPELKNDVMGKSVIISKTRTSEEILQNMALKRRIKLEKISKDKAIQSQEGGGMLYFKKNLKARTFLLELFGKTIPIYKTELFNPKFTVYIKTILLYMHTYASSKRYLWCIIPPYMYLRSFLGKILRFMGIIS